MYIKSLELENFKSFGGLKVIPFFPGFTAITGPNGSGKSNISDAILFTLGPKSSKVIRAGKLEDLIFDGGGEGQRSKKCRVSLVFDNSSREVPIDSDEIRLTRVIKRSSTSDNCYSHYYVNGKNSSLGGFEEILSSIGLYGHGFNLVQQGDINSIVRMTATERRKVIDLVSGIAKFDEDISKAEDKRLGVEGNMEMVKAVLDEVKAQAKSLKEQRDQAIRYEELKGEISRCRYLLLKKSISALEKDLERTRTEIGDHEREIAGIQDLISDKKEAKVQKELKYDQIEIEIAEMGGDEARKIKEELDQLRIEEARIKERIKNRLNEKVAALQELRTLDPKRAALERSIGESSKKIALVKGQLGEITSLLVQKRGYLEELKTDLSMSDGELLSLRRDSIKARERIAELDKAVEVKGLEVKSLKEKLETLRLRLAEREENLKQLNFEIKDTSWRIGEGKKHRGGIEQEIGELESTFMGIKKLLGTKAEELRDVEGELIKAREDYGSRPARLGPWDEIIGARDRRELKGVIGLVDELIDIEKAHEIPVRVAAGARMNCVIVKDDRAAESCITYLKKRGLGRVVFLPLNKMSPRKPGAKSILAERDRNSIGFVIDLAKFDDFLRNAMEYVFGDTVVVRDLGSARKLMGGVRLVTLDGELIEASGAMIGGTVRLPPSRAGARKQASKLAELTQRREALSQTVSDLKKKGDDLYLSIREKKIDRSSDRTDELSAELLKLSEERERKVALYKGEEKELAAMSSSISEGRRIFEKNEIDLLAAREGYKKLEEKLVTLTKGSKGEELRRAEDEVKRLETLGVELRSSNETAGNQMTLFEERLEELEKRVGELTERERDSSQEAERLGIEVKTIAGKIGAHEEVERKLIEHITDLSQRRDSLYRDLNDLELEIDKLDSRVRAHIDMMDELRLKIPLIEDQLLGMRGEIQTFPDFRDLNLDLDLSVDQIKRKMSKGEKELELMGPVNMRAIEDYERVVTKQGGLEDELEKLDKDRQRLIELVDEIKSRKVNGFFSLYWDIREEFCSVYEILSGGGSAEMVLENEQNPFLGGLVIRAKPKGKRTLRMESLSGGEKSLVALAFVLAIQKVRPSIFYLFDEVDMFLDAANAGSVAKLIKTRARQAQVIVISLRKSMVKEADNLYGVSMTRPGVSEMIGKISSEILEVEDKAR